MKNDAKSGEKAQNNAELNILESRLFALARQDRGLFGRRLLMEIAKNMQAIFTGADLTRDGITRFRYDRTLFSDRTMSVAIRDLMGGETKTNHTAVIAALRDLTRSVVDYYDGNTYLGVPVFKQVGYSKKGATIVYELNDKIVEVFANMLQGYVLYNFDIAVRLSSEVSILFYKLVYNRNNGYEFRYSLDGFRRDFNIPIGKYKQGRDLLKLVELAKSELDVKADVSFTYEVELGRPDGGVKVGRLQIVGFTVKVVRKQKEKTAVTARQLVVGSLKVYDYLKTQRGFSHVEIVNNSKTITAVVEQMGEARALELFANIKVRENASSQKGYFISAVKKALQNYLAKRESGWAVPRIKSPQTQAASAVQAQQEVIKRDADEERMSWEGGRDEKPLLPSANLKTISDVMREQNRNRFTAMTLDELEKYRGSVSLEKCPDTFVSAWNEKIAEKKKQQSKE